MSIHNVAAGSLPLPSVPVLESVSKYLAALSPRTRLFLASGGLLALILQYLRIRTIKRTTGGGYYVENLNKV